MRLIDAQSLSLVEFFDPKIPEYAILSHTWEDGEVSFQEMGLPSPQTRKKPGFIKITKACQTALQLGHGYIWIDTCCIDKSSSAELTESINSMYEWYRRSEICIAFLSDFRDSTVDPKGSDAFSSCRWFTRGWTLQELIAPREINFYNATWEQIGTKASMAPILAAATRIPTRVIEDSELIRRFSIAQRMSWAADRETTRIEDRAYSLLGLFDINMAMIYGEGAKAFQRLQDELLKRSNDLTILGWGNPLRHPNPDEICSALARDPDDFRDCGDLQRSPIFEMPLSHTSMGLQLVQRRLFIVPHPADTSDAPARPEPPQPGSCRYQLEVGCRNQYVEHRRDHVTCIALQQLGFGIYFRVDGGQLAMFDHRAKSTYELTGPHKFLLGTAECGPNIQFKLGNHPVGQAFQGAIYIAPPSPADRHVFRADSPTPVAAYDHATALCFLPQGIGMEVFGCSYSVAVGRTQTRKPRFVHFGVLVASEYMAKTKLRSHPRLTIVNLKTEEAKMLFLLMRRNPEEPMPWFHALQFLGQVEGQTSISIVDQGSGSVVDISGEIGRREVTLNPGGLYFLPSLELKVHVRVEGGGAGSGGGERAVSD